MLDELRLEFSFDREIRLAKALCDIPLVDFMMNELIFLAVKNRSSRLYSFLGIRDNGKRFIFHIDQYNSPLRNFFCSRGDKHNSVT